MQLHFSPSMRSITISSSSNGGNGNGGVGDLMKIKVAARHISYRTLFHTILILAFLLPFVFILTALVTLEGVNKCSTFDSYEPIYNRQPEVVLKKLLIDVNRVSTSTNEPESSRRADPFANLHVLYGLISCVCMCMFKALPWRLFRTTVGAKASWRTDDSGRLVKDFVKVLNQVNSEKVPDNVKLPDSFSQLVSEMKNNKYSAKEFALILKGMMERSEREIRESKFAELMNKHFAASAIPKSIHCLSLRLTDEYSSNAHARRQLPSPELLPLLSDNSYHHFVLSTDNILAASVVVTSAVQSSLIPEKIIFHVITDKKTYAGMHSWFALNPMYPAIVEVKGIHQFDWLTRENVPVLEAVENHNGIRDYYHGNHIAGANLSDTTPRTFASKLQARSPKYISLLNHLRIYLPELFPNLDKVVFLDDDVVIQRDLTPLWEIDLNGKVNGAVETCKGEDEWVMSKRFKNYFNFSHPLISKNLNPDECAWAYGMNIFDLRAWRKTNIRDTYHSWLKENLKSNLTLWKLGTLPPALIAFKGHVHPIDPSWHMLGLGYQNKTKVENVKNAAVIHFNGQSKPWLEIGFEHLRPFWTKYVNYSNDFIRNCHVLE
ncbi:putative galacturonosyltransferase 14 [Sesamum angolense]|uniref:Hexosyltransferase n=1 Tax=Sesamum angolense TaxID=2727404 RepID=A0AAE1XE73_9LAMI|nr:putative galacturonosyltransferase 14 [Sesamum angolense]